MKSICSGVKNNVEQGKYYELSNSSYQLRGDGDTCFPSKSTLNSRGTITPGNYVGTLELVVAKKGEKDIPFFSILNT